MQGYAVVRGGSLYDRYRALSPDGEKLAGGSTLAEVLPAIREHAERQGSRRQVIRYYFHGDRGILTGAMAGRIHAADRGTA
jgi:hypothetical protein